MAENKNSFVMYADFVHTLRKLVEDDRKNGTNNAGELFLHTLEYVNDNDPEPVNFTVEITFEPIKQALKRDLRKFDEKREKSSIAGREGNLKRWNHDLFVQYSNGRISLNEAEKIANNRRLSGGDNTRSGGIANIADNVSDNVSVSDNDTSLEKKQIVSSEKFNFKKELIEYGFEPELVNDWMAVRRTKKATNTKTAFQIFITEIEKLPQFDKNKILQICVAKDWKGLQHKWILNLIKENNNGKSTSRTEQNESDNNARTSRIVSELLQGM